MRLPASEHGHPAGSLSIAPRIVCRRGEELALFERLRRDREPAVRDALIERFMPLAQHLARRYPGGAERDDLVQVAALALVKAVDRFDPVRGSAFASFATPTILGEIKRHFRDFGWPVRVPRELQELAVKIERASVELTGRLGRSPTPAELADGLGVDVERVLDALACETAHRPIALDQPSREGAGDPPPVVAAVEERGYASVENAAEVDSLLGVLSERDRAIVNLRFREELLQREIADLLGISQMQVSRVLARAIATLREHATSTN
jgi:RNA polymerase sigma-B factor